MMPLLSNDARVFPWLRFIVATLLFLRYEEIDVDDCYRDSRLLVRELQKDLKKEIE